jgi:hypothetical protein
MMVTQEIRLLEKQDYSRSKAAREVGLLEKKIDRVIWLIEQSATRAVRNRENWTREVGRAREKLA